MPMFLNGQSQIADSTYHIEGPAPGGKKQFAIRRTPPPVYLLNFRQAYLPSPTYLPAD
jgi:hypothetical protein